MPLEVASQKWAQCDRCGTWRRLPPHVDVDRLPERWFCEMNVWDAARARCDAPEPGATTPEAAAAPLESPGAEPQWVQCDGCQKWRRVPHYVDVASLPDRWFCAMNRWDPLRNSCAAPEETAEEQLAPKKRRGPAPGKPARRAPESAGAKRGRNQYTARRDAEERARAEARAAGRPWPPPGGFRWEPARPSPQRPPRSPPRGPSTNAAQVRGGAPYLQAARPPKPKPVWNWVQCERAACRKWRRLPLSLKPEALPDAWVCSMNTWDQRFASCEAAQEDEDAIDDGQSEKKLSFREIIFNAEGKYRPPFSERSAVSSIFAVGTTTVNGRTRDVAAYEDSPVYVDAHAAVEEEAARARRVVVADVEAATIRCMNAKTCIIPYDERHRPAESESERVGRARCELVAGGHDQPVVGGVAVHRERRRARAHARVRDERRFDAPEGRRRGSRRRVRRDVRRGWEGWRYWRSARRRRGRWRIWRGRAGRRRQGRRRFRRDPGREGRRARRHRRRRRQRPEIARVRIRAAVGHDQAPQHTGVAARLVWQIDVVGVEELRRKGRESVVG